MHDRGAGRRATLRNWSIRCRSWYALLFGARIPRMDPRGILSHRHRPPPWGASLPWCGLGGYRHNLTAVVANVVSLPRSVCSWFNAPTVWHARVESVGIGSIGADWALLTFLQFGDLWRRGLAVDDVPNVAIVGGNRVLVVSFDFLPLHGFHSLERALLRRVV